MHYTICNLCSWKTSVLSTKIWQKSFLTEGVFAKFYCLHWQDMGDRSDSKILPQSLVFWFLLFATGWEEYYVQLVKIKLNSSFLYWWYFTTTLCSIFNNMTLFFSSVVKLNRLRRAHILSRRVRDMEFRLSLINPCEGISLVTRDWGLSSFVKASSTMK